MTLKPPAFVKNWPFLAVIALLAAVLVWLGPDERTLGDGIKAVYIHVSLTWVGLLGLVVAGVLGLGVAFTAKSAWYQWLYRLGWVGFGFYVAGTAVSALASQINWGSVFWQEPRMAAALNMVAAGLIVYIVIGWIGDKQASRRRLAGLLATGYAILLLWSTYGAELVLHPRNAIGTSSARGIQFTFLGLFILMSLLAGWIIWRWQEANA